MIKKLAIIIIGTIISYWGYSLWQSSVQTDQLQAAKHERAEKFNLKINDIASKYNALTDWPAKLLHDSGDRMSQILSIELQDLWTKGSILFVGRVADITRVNDETVQLLVDYAPTNNTTFISTVLSVRLQCNKILVNPLLSKFPKSKNDYLEIAIIANIENIESSRKGDSLFPHNLITGVGKCVDIIYDED